MPVAPAHNREIREEVLSTAVAALEKLRAVNLISRFTRAVNLIHAVLSDDEGVTQARGC